MYRLVGAQPWLERWQSRDQPNPTEIRFLREWLDGLREDPRRSPSAESSREHPHRQDELRGAFLLDAGPAFVAYAIDDTESMVRILHIGAEPVEGITFRFPT
jgi:hypothetical protein